MLNRSFSDSADMARRSILVSLLLVVLVALTNFVLWTAANPPHEAPDWHGVIEGAAYSPFPLDGDPNARHATVEEMRKDVEFLSRHMRSLRTYSVLDGLERIPALAADTRLTVTLGAWIDKRRERNRLEIERLVQTTRDNRNVVRVLVGNEAVLRNDLTPAEIIPYIREVRARVRVPVSTAETWGTWLEHPELADEVDFLAVHVLPYWEEGATTENAVEHAVEKLRLVRRTFPGKPIVVTEIGWPSAGRKRFDSAPSLVRQAQFVRAFLSFAEQENIEYYVMEAIDQPWKTSIEGSVGPYWGIFDATRHAKFPMTGPVHEVPDWPILAGLSIVLAAAPMLWFAFRFRQMRWPARLFFLCVVQATATGAVYIYIVSRNQYLTPLTWIPWSFLVASLVVLAVVFVIEAFETADVFGTRLRRRFAPAPGQGPREWPKVSLHLPIHNEPPEMVKTTLDSLARLDYPDFEVIVVDNNTKDEGIWRPVEEHCRLLDEMTPGRFHFHHVDPLPGFKAGALNYALTKTARDAAIIGVVDADYVVESGWLKATVPHFDDADIGFVQAPQDHRDIAESPFKRMIGWEYAGFFDIGMVQRNERDAIIQHGTMVLMRRAAVDGVGGWATWCIVEDAEMGLKLMRAGWRSVYLRDSLGKGLTPDGFKGYKVQRFRWAYGAVQILRHYWRDLVFGGNLTKGQRYHFACGWAPWIADGANVVFAGLSLLWTALALFVPEHFVLPETPFVVPVIALFLFKIAQTLALYRARVGCGWRERIGAAIAGLALTYTVGKAVLIGLVTSKRPFARTPKADGRPALIQGILMAREEGLLMLLLWLAAALTWHWHSDFDPESRFWTLVLVLTSLPYLAALSTSVVASFSEGSGAGAARRPEAVAAVAQAQRVRA